MIKVNLDKAVATDEEGNTRSLNDIEKATIYERIGKVQKYRNKEKTKYGAGYRKLMEGRPLYYRFNDKNYVVTGVILEDGS